MVPTVSCAGVMVSVAPLVPIVAPAGRVAVTTWMSGCASGLVTYWARLTVTLRPASTVTATGLADGGGALITVTLSVPPAVAPAGVIFSVPVAPGAAPL